jgi:hypothetical protein
MDRREFLKLAAAVPTLVWIPALPYLTHGPDYHIRLTGVGESSAIGKMRVFRHYDHHPFVLLNFIINTWGGMYDWTAQLGDEIIWTPGIGVKVEGLAVASIALRDKELRYGPYGLISETSYHDLHSRSV